MSRSGLRGVFTRLRDTFRASKHTRRTFLGIVLLGVIMLGVAAIEWKESRDELLGALESEASTLVTTVNRAGETIAESSARLEELLLGRLTATGRLAAHLEEHGALTNARLAALARENDIGFLAVANVQGRLMASSSPDVAPAIADAALEGIAAVGRGEYTWVSLGSIALPPRSSMLLVAHERRGGQGVILAGIEDGVVLDFRRRTGIGRLLREAGRTQGIEYAAVQDRDGILSASEAVTELTEIATDTFLLAALTSGEPRTRLLDLPEGRVLEVAQRIDLPDNHQALTRIALSLSDVRAIQQRAMRRILFIALGVFVAGGFLIGFLLAQERYGLLREEHRRVTTSTDLVLDNIADAVVAIDSAGTVTVYNSAARRLFGHAEDKAPGAAYADLFPDDPLQLHSAMRSGSGHNFEDALTGSSGDAMFLAVSTSVIHAANGAPELAIAVARDLTEERRLREQLRRREQLSAMGSLASGIAHEIRNPLNAIGVIAQRFRHEFVPTEDAEEYRALADTVRGEVARVNGIITQFLEFARPAPLRTTPQDLAASTRRALRVIESQARAAGVVVECDELAQVRVDLDEEKWRQALINLFQNALDAMPAGGTLRCAVSRDGRDALLAISDTGVGISPDVIPRIFNIYFTTKSSGTGLGLTLVHQIVSEHGGSIDVRSIAHGGTTFTIRVPLAHV